MKTKQMQVLAIAGAVWGSQKIAASLRLLVGDAHLDHAMQRSYRKSTGRKQPAQPQQKSNICISQAIIEEKGLFKKCGYGRKVCDIYIAEGQGEEEEDEPECCRAHEGAQEHHNEDLLEECEEDTYEKNTNIQNTINKQK